MPRRDQWWAWKTLSRTGTMHAFPVDLEGPARCGVALGRIVVQNDAYRCRSCEQLVGAPTVGKRGRRRQAGSYARRQRG